MEAFGFWKFARFSELNISQRYVSLVRSRIEKTRWIPRSAVNKPGPTKTKAPALPKAYGCGIENACTLNHLLSVRWSASRLGVPLRLGRSVVAPGPDCE